MQTLGEKRVRTTFNPSEKDTISQIKQKTAELIDMVQVLKTEEAAKKYDTETPEQFKERAGERIRLVSLAQTAYEEAAMWGVKAATL